MIMADGTAAPIPTDESPVEAGPPVTASHDDISDANLSPDFRDLVRMVNEHSQRDLEAYLGQVADPEYTNHLREAGRAYLAEERFSPGDLVTWTMGYLQDVDMPGWGCPAMFLRYVTAEDHVPRNRDTIGKDCLIGVLDHSPRFVAILCDSRRFTVYET